MLIELGPYFLDIKSKGTSLDGNNHTIMTRSGLKSGEVILDAGCGVGGPSVYWTKQIPSIRLSPYQVEVTKGIISQGSS